MPGMRTPPLSPILLDGTAGSLFGVYYPPVSGTNQRCAILHVPAFAEEMNKARRMVALQARAFARRGYGVLVLDLFGTGDSAGDFVDARWDIWLRDIATGVDWLQSRSHTEVCLWGLRLGGLLALHASLDAPASIRRLLLWNPVLNGESYLQQFLRLRVAAAIFSSDAKTETTQDLLQTLNNGIPVEIAGYELHPDLAKALSSAKAPQPGRLSGTEISCVEVGPDREKGLSVPLRRQLEAWTSVGHIASATLVQGDPFWSTLEITEAPELLAFGESWPCPNQ